MKAQYNAIDRYRLRSERDVWVERDEQAALMEPVPYQNFVGGPGDDTFVSNPFVADNFDGGGGSDTVDYRSHGNSNVNVFLHVSGAPNGPDGDTLISIENIITGGGNDTVSGNAAVNRIETGAGNDFLLGGGGDTLIGGVGSDQYYATSDDIIIEAVDGGTDEVNPYSSVYTLPENVENLGNSNASGNLMFTGNALNNVIIGGSSDDMLYGLGGNDALDGRGGSDTLVGGQGDDLYIMFIGHNGTDAIIELSGEGTDTVSGNLPSMTLPDNVENLIGGAYAIGPTLFGNTLTGNALANTITGSEAADIIYGMDGDDTLLGDLGNDTIHGGNGNDFLYGASGANLLYGEGGDDILRVAVTSNNLTLDGGDGYDTLDLLVSGSYSGQISNIERVRFTSSIVDLTLTAAQASSGLASNVLFFGETGAGRIAVNLGVGEQFNATAYQFQGSIFSFTINGAGGDEVIRSTDGFNSTLNGGGGNDTIFGGIREDTITGGAGADTLYGGEGIDRLNAEVGDTLADGGAGFDTLAYSASGTVTGTLANLEYFLVLGGASISISAARLVAGFGATGSFAGTGAITINMVPGDLALALSGYTFIPGSNLTLTVNGSSNGEIIKGINGTIQTIDAGGGNDQVRGGNFSDTIKGGDGDDKIDGGGGADLLTGGAGSDTFRFQSTNATGLGSAADRITDFAIGSDRLAFAAIDADLATPGDQAFGFIGSAAFTGGNLGQIRYQNSGADLLVQIDADGNGTADMEIILQGLAGQTLTSGDFVL